MTLRGDEREQLLVWAQGGQPALAQRSRIVLACAEGASSKAVAMRLSVTEATVGKWRRRFIADRLEGLLDEPRQGRPTTISIDQVRDVVIATFEPPPPNSTQWSRASMAQHSGLSKSTIGRIWKQFGLKPHRAQSITLFGEELFAEQVCHVVALYLDPPESAFVYWVDESGPPTDRPTTDRPTTDRPTAINRYSSHRAGRVFAGFELTGDALSSAIHRRGRAAEFKNFLTRIDAEVPDQLDVHLVCDTFGTPGSPAITAWRARHSRFHLHFIPTGSNWVQQLERRFEIFAEELIRRGDGARLAALEAAIASWVAERDSDLTPFGWSKNTSAPARTLPGFGKH